MNTTAFLLQSAKRYITNCDRHYKVRWKYHKLRELSLLQIATALLLQNATWFIKNCDRSFPQHDDYYKLRQSRSCRVHCTLPPFSKLEPSCWSEFQQQSLHQLGAEKSRKKLIVSIWGNNEFNRRKFPFDIPKAFRKQTKWFAIWCSVY